MNHLTLFDISEMFKLLKEYKNSEVARIMEVSAQTVRFQRRRYGVTTVHDIDQAIQAIERQIQNPFEFSSINYEKQARCTPDKIFFKCHSCGFVGGEKNIDQTIEHLLRHKVQKKEELLVCQAI